MPITVLQHIDQLQHSSGKHTHDHHHHQAAVESPETNPYIFFKVPPKRLADCLSNDEDDEADAQYAEHAYHRCMGVISGQQRTRLEVADDRQVDEKTENSGTDEVPEADRHEEIECPLVGYLHLKIA